MTTRDDLPGPGEDDVDARFAEMVSHLGEVADLPEDDDGDSPVAQPRYPVAPWVAAGPRDWDATGQIEAAEENVDAQERFVAPDPGPIFGGDPLLTMAWLAVVAIPVGLLVTVIFWRAAPPVLFQAGGVVFLLGLAVLFWRMPSRRDPDETDNGAVV